MNRGILYAVVLSVGGVGMVIVAILALFHLARCCGLCLRPKGSTFQNLYGLPVPATAVNAMIYDGPSLVAEGVSSLPLSAESSDELPWCGVVEGYQRIGARPP